MANDRFAAIADSYAVDTSRGLISPQPEPVTGSIALDAGADAAFVPPKKMTTKTELYDALAQLRREMRPWLQDLAPHASDDAVRIDLKQFMWSIDGEPAVPVTIPHYGERLGKHKAVYTTTLTLPDYDASARRVVLTFRGVDYIAEVFVNGEFVGQHEGFFAPFEFDVTEYAHPGDNEVRVTVKNDFTMTGSSCAEGLSADGDKIYAATGPGWDDPEEGWHHCPPGMGIYQKVYAEIRANEYITDLFVRNGNELWVECMGTDITAKPVEFEVSVYGQNFAETVFENVRMAPSTCIEAGVGDTLTEAQLIAEGKLGRGTPLLLGNGFNRFQFPITIANPRIWNPDTPWLYQVQVKIIVDGAVTSVRTRQFGIRTFEVDTDSSPKGMFLLNGKKLRLRGANTMGYEQQCVMHEDFDQLLDDMLLAKLCNMNFLRLTQRPVQEEIYDLCDRIGLMIQTDLPLFGTVRINQMAETIRQAGEMEHLIRTHPCCILSSYINEPFPNASNKPHRMIRRNDLMRMFEAADTMVHLHNPERVTKHVDGDYDPPCATLPDNHCYTMWYNGHGIDFGRMHKGYWLEVKPDWYWGCGEFGAEGLDFPDVMRETYPAHWIAEPFNPANIKRAQTANFHYFFYDTPDTMENWVKASHKHQAFATKMMTNALRRSNGVVTFAIHLFIDAWPSGWMKTIMDCRRTPKPAFFTYRDALTPLKADLRCDRFTWFGGETLTVESRVCNDGAPVDGANVRYMLTVGGKVVASGAQPAVIGDCCVTGQGVVTVQLPEVCTRTTATLTMGIEKDGEILHWTAEDFTVFPKKAFAVPEIVSAEEYYANRAGYDARMASGATVILAPLAPGAYEMAGHRITAKACGMHPVYFVSGNTGHPLTAGFEKGDFSYWYDERVDRMSPMAYATVTVDGGETVLSGGNKDGVGDWIPADICTILPVGKGKLVVCQIDLTRGKHNPVCAEFADRLARV